MPYKQNIYNGSLHGNIKAEYEMWKHGVYFGYCFVRIS